MDTEQQTLKTGAKETSEPTAAELIQNAYDKLKASDAEGAEKLLGKALEDEYENQEIIYALKCVRWWLAHSQRIEGFQNPYEKGGFILSLLKQYYAFLELLSGGGDFDQCQYAVRRFVFSSALRCFEDLLGDRINQHDPGLLLLVGRCYKGVGNYIDALKYLEQAIRFKREDSETMAELADVNALLGEDRIAKAYFREAFFLDAANIDLRSMESSLILRLCERITEERGYKDAELAEWIPVWGRIWGVFSVKRELKQVEVGRLRQSIFNLDAEWRAADPKREAALRPRLLNRYFWLVDHYENTREDPALINEVLLKIKITDPEIYERYVR